MMNVWPDLIKTALLGTARQPLALPAQPGQLGDVLARIDVSDAEHALLSASAIVSAYRRVGAQPVIMDVPALTTCTEETLPRCSARASLRLMALLNGEHQAVLPEWLNALALAHQRVPEERLPDLLDYGQTHVDLQTAIILVIGQCGAWLATQNPDWAYALNVEDESIWHTGTRAERLALLKRLRERDPQHALERLNSTWKEDAPDDRAAFISALSINLSMNDEPFLEAALDDRRKEVRQVAAHWLMQLPESRLCQRMIDRTTSLLSIKKQLLKTQLDVILPAACDSDMQRDGLEAKPPKGVGEKAWWLQQLLAATPLPAWTQRWPIATLIQAAAKSEWHTPVLVGLATAAERQRDADWCEALLKADGVANESIEPTKLLAALSADRREAYALSVLQARPSLENDQPARAVLLACQSKWSDELSREVLNRLAVHVAKSATTAVWVWPAFMEAIAAYFAPELAAKAAQRLMDALPADSNFAPAVDKFLARLQFRHDMLKEITG
jgi:hypothetical protein